MYSEILPLPSTFDEIFQSTTSETLYIQNWEESVIATHSFKKLCDTTSGSIPEVHGKRPPGSSKYLNLHWAVIYIKQTHQ